MIKKIFRTENDLANLSSRRIQTASGASNVDYRRKIVGKPWGYEYLLFENNAVAIWILFIKFRHSTSLHCHPQKLTSLVLLGGRATISTLTDEFFLSEKDAIIIDAGVFHATMATASDGILLMEIETPPNKHDLVRLRDEYGRRDLGYEKESTPIDDLDKNNYCDFHNVNCDLAVIDARATIGKRNLYISKNNIEKILVDLVDAGTKVCLIDKNLVAMCDSLSMKTGEIVDVDEFRQIIAKHGDKLKNKILLLLT